MVALVGLSIRILILSPARFPGRTLLIHGSAAPEFPSGVGVNEIPPGSGVSVGPAAGMEGKAAVGAGVFVAVVVGVAVGMAALVSATSVEATANAVLRRSVKLTVGIASGVLRAPHALMSSVIMSAWARIEKRFIMNFFFL